jgi:hypothetical protein
MTADARRAGVAAWQKLGVAAVLRAAWSVVEFGPVVAAGTITGHD